MAPLTKRDWLCDTIDKCGHMMHNHGWIDTLEGGHIVCVGDWIATGVEGEHWLIKPGIFAKTYEPVPEICTSFGADPDLKPGPLTQNDRGWSPD